MAFLRSALPEDYVEPIRGPRLTLRPPTFADYSTWAELRALSRAHLTPWEPTWARDELSRSSYRRRLKAYTYDARDDLGYALFITRDAALLGGLTISGIRRGAVQSASLGYWIGAPYAGQGIMKEAVCMVVSYAFSRLKLHRLEAASMIDNVASQRVLERNAFLREGMARKYLKINGRWVDHYRYGLVEEDVLRVASGTGGES